MSRGRSIVSSSFRWTLFLLAILLIGVGSVPLEDAGINSPIVEPSAEVQTLPQASPLPDPSGATAAVQPKNETSGSSEETLTKEEEKEAFGETSETIGGSSETHQDPVSPDQPVDNSAEIEQSAPQLAGQQPTTDSNEVVQTLQLPTGPLRTLPEQQPPVNAVKPTPSEATNATGNDQSQAPPDQSQRSEQQPNQQQQQQVPSREAATPEVKSEETMTAMPAVSNQESEMSASENNGTPENVIIDKSQEQSQPSAGNMEQIPSVPESDQQRSQPSNQLSEAAQSQTPAPFVTDSSQQVYQPNEVSVKESHQLEVQEQPNAATNQTQASANPEPSEEHDSTLSNQIGDHQNQNQNRTNSLELPVVEEKPDYELDRDSCGKLAATLPPQILNMTVERILNTIGHLNCSETLNLKLLPATNKQISGYVMEVGSSPLDIDVFTVAPLTRVYCSLSDSSPSSSLRLSLKMIQERSYDHCINSGWRLYPRLNQVELPVELLGKFGHNQAKRNQRSSASRPNDKCQPFEVKNGIYKLLLRQSKTSLTFEVQLVKLNEQSYSASGEHGGQIKMVDFKLDKLYLDHEVHLNGLLTTPSKAGRQQGAFNHLMTSNQILHDRNNHHRRNNWLLDAYGNWLRHEYRAQLLQLLTVPGSFVDRMNQCF